MSKRKQYPQKFAMYRHHKGGLYQVINNALMEGTKEPVVVYKDHPGGYVWVRPLSEWWEKFTAVEDR